VPLAVLICLANEDVQEEGEFRLWVQTWSRAADGQFDTIVLFSKVPHYFSIFRRMQETRIQSYAFFWVIPRRL
jgi:hypothetical protein